MPSGRVVRSAGIFDALRGWAQTLGAERLDALEDDLWRITPAELLRLDVPGWLGG